MFLMDSVGRSGFKFVTFLCMRHWDLNIDIHLHLMPHTFGELAPSMSPSVLKDM